MNTNMPQAVDRLATHLQRGAILAMAVAVPMVVFGRGAMQAVLAVAALLAVAAAWRGCQPVLDVQRCRPLLVVVGVVALAWLPSIAVSLDPLVSFGAWARTLVLALGVMVLWTALRRDRDGYHLALKLLLLASLLAVLPAVALAWSLDVSHPVARSMKSKASAFAVLLPLIIYAGVILRRRWLFAAAVAGGGVIALVLGTASRSGLAGLAVASAVVVAFYAARHRRLWIVALGVAAALALISQVKQWNSPNDQEAVQYQLYLPHSMFDTHRQVIWRFTFHKFLEKPVFGWGINVINQSPGAHENVPGMLQEFIPSHPHSWLVEVSAETGAVGFLALVGAIGWGFVRLGRAYLHRSASAALAGCAAMTVFWSSGAFNFSIWAVWWQLVLMVSLALIFGRDQRHTPG